MNFQVNSNFKTVFAESRAKLAGILILAGVFICIFFGVTATYALMAGVVVTFAVGNPAPELTSWVGQWMLKIAVVGLGAGINLGMIVTIGAQNFWMTALSILLSFAAGLFLARLLKVHEELAILVSVGTAICGGSAIAAVSGVIKPRTGNMVVALSIVFLLNAIALVIFPPLGAVFGFDQRQFGIWAALAIHDTSSVVGAALAYGKEATEVATTTKLVRALWIAPVAMLIAVWQARRESADKKRIGVPIPGFIVGFLLVAAIFTYVERLAPWRAEIASHAKQLFAGTLFLIGAGFSRSVVRQVGVRPAAFAIILWFSVMVAIGGMLKVGWIN